MEIVLAVAKKIIPAFLFRRLQPVYHFLINWLAAVVYGHPSDKLLVVGITGTTGKTTTAYLLAKALRHSGWKVGYTSTALFSDGERDWLNDKKMTMVGRFFTQHLLAKMVKNRCQVAIIETTSEGIVQFRHRFINYDIVLITGLYPEHIESHGSFEKYRQAKGKLFSHLKRCRSKLADQEGRISDDYSSRRIPKTIIVNLDGGWAEYFLSFWAEKKVGCWLEQVPPKFRNWPDLDLLGAKQVGTDRGRIYFYLGGKKVQFKLLGKFNAANILLAFAAGRALGARKDDLLAGLQQTQSVPGRLEVIEGKGFKVIVDYAFEPKAMAKLYETAKTMPHQRIIHILGSAGGGRDVWRRPKLGGIAAQNADIIIVTDEDPYDDDPEEIIEQVAVGAREAGKIEGKNLFKILNRRQAIRYALRLARTGDLVLVTGKGCEQAICVKNSQKIPWDDRKVIKEELDKL